MKLVVMLLAAVVLLLSASTTYQFVDARQARAQIRQNTGSIQKAVCALRSNVQKRIDTSNQFLKENPSGSGGITPTLLKDSIKRDQNTINALRFVECPPTKGSLDD